MSPPRSVISKVVGLNEMLDLLEKERTKKRETEGRISKMAETLRQGLDEVLTRDESKVRYNDFLGLLVEENKEGDIMTPLFNFEPSNPDELKVMYRKQVPLKDTEILEKTGFLMGDGWTDLGFIFRLKDNLHLIGGISNLKEDDWILPYGKKSLSYLTYASSYNKYSEIKDPDYAKYDGFIVFGNTDYQYNDRLLSVCGKVYDRLLWNGMNPEDIPKYFTSCLIESGMPN